MNLVEHTEKNHKRAAAEASRVESKKRERVEAWKRADVLHGGLDAKDKEPKSVKDKVGVLEDKVCSVEKVIEEERGMVCSLRMEVD